MSNKEEHVFAESEKIGKIGEKLVHTHLIKLGYKVTDVSHLWDYRNKDIDFIAEINGREYTIEVKCDEITERTGNIFYETISNTTTNTLGCMVKTKADYIFYVLKHKGKAIIIKTEEYKKWFNENMKEFTPKYVPNKGTGGREDFAGFGYPIPISRELSRAKGPTIYGDMPKDIFKVVKLLVD